MLPAEHPASQHRNLIGLQRTATIASMNQRVDELQEQGDYVGAFEVVDMMTELSAVWDNEID